LTNLIQLITIGVLHPFEQTSKPKTLEKTLMKTKSAVVRSIGVLLALLVFIALPSPLLAEVCGTCYEPQCGLYYGPPKVLYLELETECPSAATIFYTKTINTPNNTAPCHNGPDACPGSGTYSCPNGTLISIPYGSTIYIQALAYKSGLNDSGVTACDQHNPNN